MLSASDIRRLFLDYFARHGHQEVASGPLVPANDPTLLFTNAGMVQFKNVFTGQEKRAYSRAVTSQKCVRAGGKHNDLENDGYTARHHTFFEMLGNFSFGDYFKEQAIAFAWDFVTAELGLPDSKLLVTVYETDEEAVAAWQKVAGLGDDRILRIPGDDNFWQMGDTGPCGPCSEIFYDHGPEIAGGPPGSADEDGDRYKEIWNLVFMQYEQFADGTRRELPYPSVDTGMGLERIAAVMQGVVDNYDTDLLRNLMAAAARVLDGDPDRPDQRASYKVIADHLRATAFLIAEGVLPSNEGRGYVLRRIMRRGMRHAHMLGAREPLMYKLVGELVALMGDHFPELKRGEALITETLKAEEGKFKQTLDRGLKLLEAETAKLGDGEKLPGEVAFKLYDTYGFPLDLTADVLRGQGRSVDVDGFNQAMEAQRATARAAWAGSGEAATDPIWFSLRDKLGGTEFLGYDYLVADAEITAIVQNGATVESLAADGAGWVLLNQSPFYGEAGGQVGDTGSLTGTAGSARVTDAQKMAGTVTAHWVSVSSGTLTVGDVVTAAVDAERRDATRANHSATHLLHAALRRHLGAHVMQKGSLVAPDRLRFDISQPAQIGAERLRAVEDEVNERIRGNTPVTTRLMETGEAIEAGAMALFGEKYGEEVRVVRMGGTVAGADGGELPYSMELCGGTHVARTGDIGAFKIVSESAVGSGVRRVEAVTGSAAMALFNRYEATVSQSAELLRCRSDEVVARLSGLAEERKRLERELAEARRKLAAAGEGGGGKPETRDVAGLPFVGKVLEDTSPKELKPMADELKRKLGSAVIALVAVPAARDGKASLVVGVTDDLAETVDAVELVRTGAQALGGKGGGGRPDMAQAGGPQAGEAENALSAIEQALAEKARAA